MKKVNRARILKLKGQARGFTLMEMILVLAIIGLLVGLGIFAMKGVIIDAETGKATADLNTMETNLLRYRTMAGLEPSQAQGLLALAKMPAGNPVPKSWHKLTDESALIDPWGRPYQYRNPGKRDKEGHDVFSLGKDGQEGTPDDVYRQ